MKVDIVSAECIGTMVKVTKELTPGGLNEHHFPIVAVTNYAAYYGVTNEQALDFILFEPFHIPDDTAGTVEETIQNIKTRVQAGVGLASCHQLILEEVRKRGEVPQTDLDSPSGSRGPVGELGPGEQHGE